MSQTILYVPPADRPDVLAPSVGGAYPPIRYRHRWTDGSAEFTKWGPWVSYVFMAAKTESVRTLLLSLNGTPDAIGMGRARDVLATACGVFAADKASDFDRVFGGFGIGGNSEYAYFVGEDKRLHTGPLARMNPTLVDGIAHDSPLPFALATILAARIGGSVVVVDG